MGNSIFSPLKNKRYSDQIAEQIQGKILKHQLELGSSLPTEQALASEFQVSRSVIREAMRILEISGLVDIRKGPTGGIFVANGYAKPIKKSLNNMVLSGEVTLDHLFDVRLLIEPYIAMEAALHAKEEDIKRLKDLMEDSANHQDEPLHLKRNNLNFHLLLAKASGNPILSILLESVFEILIDLSLDFLDLSLEKGFFKIHREMSEVIIQHNPEEAKVLMEKDIKEVREKLKGFKSHRV